MTADFGRAYKLCCRLMQRDVGWATSTEVEAEVVADHEAAAAVEEAADAEEGAAAAEEVASRTKKFKRSRDVRQLLVSVSVLVIACPCHRVSCPQLPPCEKNCTRTVWPGAPRIWAHRPCRGQ